jgi:hypothetical protein
VLALEANGIKTENKLSLGNTKIVRTALLSGEIDIYPDYTLGQRLDRFLARNEDMAKAERVRGAITNSNKQNPDDRRLQDKISRFRVALNFHKMQSTNFGKMLSPNAQTLLGDCNFYIQLNDSDEMLQCSQEALQSLALEYEGRPINLRSSISSSNLLIFSVRTPS